MNLIKSLTDGAYVGNLIKKIIKNIILVYITIRLIKKQNLNYRDAIKYGVVITFVQFVLQKDIFPTVGISEPFKVSKCNSCKIIRDFFKDNFVLIIVVLGFFVY
jgi:hypothetical protein